MAIHCTYHLAYIGQHSPSNIQPHITRTTSPRKWTSSQSGSPVRGWGDGRVDSGRGTGLCESDGFLRHQDPGRPTSSNASSESCSGSRTRPTTAPKRCATPANPTGRSSTSTHANSEEPETLTGFGHISWDYGPVTDVTITRPRSHRKRRVSPGADIGLSWDFELEVRIQRVARPPLRRRRSAP